MNRTGGPLSISEINFVYSVHSVEKKLYAYFGLEDETPISRIYTNWLKALKIREDSCNSCVYGCFSSQSFWKAGSARKGSQNGSSLRRTGVMAAGPYHMLL